MKREIEVVFVGIGAVGTEMIKVLRSASSQRLKSDSGALEREEEVAGENFRVYETKPEAFDGLDIVLFAGTEGSRGAAKQFAWEAVARGCTVIDNGDDYRMDERVPLVIPEINAEALERHQGIIANPNCSTIITLMGLAPLHRRVPLRHVTAVTFQSVSGTGRDAIDELDQQAHAWAEGREIVKAVYPRQIAFNVLPQIGSLKPEMPGFQLEEAKLLFESRQNPAAPGLQAAATCVRVPVFYAHSVAIHASFEAPLAPEEAREILAATPGVRVRDDMAAANYPTPLDVQYGDDVEVGRIRTDPSLENGLALWVVGDNIRKGAALNAVQIAEELIKRGLVGRRV